MKLLRWFDWLIYDYAIATVTVIDVVQFNLLLLL